MPLFLLKSSRPTHSPSRPLALSPSRLFGVRLGAVRPHFLHSAAVPCLNGDAGQLRSHAVNRRWLVHGTAVCASEGIPGGIGLCLGGVRVVLACGVRRGWNAGKKEA